MTINDEIGEEKHRKCEKYEMYKYVRKLQQIHAHSEDKNSDLIYIVATYNPLNPYIYIYISTKGEQFGHNWTLSRDLRTCPYTDALSHNLREINL
jgi:hypothetical protein